MDFKEKCEKFINKNLSEIKTIYQNEKNIFNKGCLFGNFSNEEKIDIRFIPMTKIPVIIRKDLDTKMNINVNSDDCIYIFCYDTNNSLLLEIGINNN